MTWRTKRVLALTVLMTAGGVLGSLALFEKSLIGEVDPNLMKVQCPGGKDWDMPGSSCQEGIIVDNLLPPAQAMPVEKQQRVDKKKKRGR